MIRWWLRNWLFEGRDPDTRCAGYVQEAKALKVEVESLKGRVRSLEDQCAFLQGHAKGTEENCASLSGRVQSSENAAATANSRSERNETRLANLEASLDGRFDVSGTLTDFGRRLEGLEERADRAQRLHRRQFAPTEPDGSAQK